jgi:hypothetical protein
MPCRCRSGTAADAYAQVKAIAGAQPLQLRTSPVSTWTKFELG